MNLEFVSMLIAPPAASSALPPAAGNALPAEQSAASFSALLGQALSVSGTVPLPPLGNVPAETQAAAQQLLAALATALTTALDEARVAPDGQAVRSTPKQGAEDALDAAAGRLPAAVGQLPPAAENAAATLRAVWPRVIELFNGLLRQQGQILLGSTPAIVTASGEPEALQSTAETAAGLLDVLPDALPAALPAILADWAAVLDVSAPPANAAAFPAAQSGLPLPVFDALKGITLAVPQSPAHGSGESLTLSVTAQAGAAPGSFTAVLSDGQGQDLLRARLHVAPAVAAVAQPSIPAAGRANAGQPVKPTVAIGDIAMLPGAASSAEDSAAGAPPAARVAAWPVQSGALPVQQADFPLLVSNPPAQRAMPGLSVLLGAVQPRGSSRPAALGASAVAAAEPALPHGGQLTARSMAAPLPAARSPLAAPQGAVPVPLPQVAAGAARTAALPDPAADLAASSSAAGQQAQPVPPAERVLPRPALAKPVQPGQAPTATWPALVPAQTDGGFDTLQRLSDLPSAGSPGQAAWPDLASLSGAASTGGLHPRLLAFTQPGMQFLPGGLDYGALAQRVLASADAARSGGDGLYEAKLELNPPQLGRMLAQIAVRGEQVAVQLAVASSLPRKQLEAGLAGLKRSLEEAGLEVAGLRVVTLDPERESGGSWQQQPEQDQPRWRPAMPAPHAGDFTKFLNTA